MKTKPLAKGKNIMNRSAIVINSYQSWRLCLLRLAVWIFIMFPTIALAQNSSLFQRPFVPVRQELGILPEQLSGPNQFPFQSGISPMTGPFTQSPLGNPPWDNPAFAGGLPSSFTFMPPIPPRTLKIHDLVSIRVEEAAQSLALGNTTSRKNTSYDAVLNDWVRFVGLDTIKPAVQSDGDPRIRGQQNEVYRGDSTMRTNESMTFNITAEISDIRPNGTIVLTARKTVSLNDNVWEASLSGVCRSQDITPDNTILSRNIFDLKIDKNERGHVRDGYSRGWLTRFIAIIKPF